jgi:hypothetical protein
METNRAGRPLAIHRKENITVPIDPIHTAIINDKPLRFFRSPVGNTDPKWYYWEEGQDEEPKPELPDFPWVSVMDLMACWNMPSNQQECALLKHEAPGRIVTIRDLAINNGQPTDHRLPCVKSFKTASGIVLIAPEIVASRYMMPTVSEETIRMVFIALRKGKELPITPVHEFRMAYDAAFRSAVDIVTKGLSVGDLKHWLIGASERETLNYIAMCRAERGDDKATFHGLQIL